MSPPTGEGPGAALARAKAALDQGDLAAAVKEVETLDGAPREAFAAWLGQAHARLSADETFTRLEGTLLVSVGSDPRSPRSNKLDDPHPRFHSLLSSPPRSGSPGSPTGPAA